MNRISRVVQLSALIALLFIAKLSTAFAYGEPDLTYKPQEASGSCSTGQAVVSDGSIYTKFRPGYYSAPRIVRHRADGIIDLEWGGWGNGGAVQIPFSSSQLLPAADGGLFAVGRQIARFSRSGTLVPSYGSFGFSDVIPSGYSPIAALQSDGSVVVYDQYGLFSRTNPHGIRDTNFGFDGRLSIPYGADSDSVGVSQGTVYAWSVEADGSLQIAGYHSVAYSPGAVLRPKLKRFRQSFSSADPSFDAGGRLVPRHGLANWLSPLALVQADGALLLAVHECIDVACHATGTAVRRFDAQGNPDLAFGDGGRTVFPLFPGRTKPMGSQVPKAMWLGPDGQITIIINGGYCTTWTPVYKGSECTSGDYESGAYVFRLNADGKLNAAFQHGKKFPMISFGANFMQLDDGKLVLPESAWTTCAPQKFLTDTPRTAAVVAEYYSPSLDHYFMTAHEFEKDFVDRGLAGDWHRTGQLFGAFSIDAQMPGTAPVCRYYGDAAGGPNSHFYSAEKFECDILAYGDAHTPQGKPAWRFERDAFRITVPEAGTCPPNLTPVYRLYNRGAEQGKDPNHRYTTDLGIHAEMQAKGWVTEGVHMCAPPSSRRDQTPDLF